MIDVPVTPVNAVCIDFAAKKANISPYIVASILAQEGGKVGQRHYNANGSYDMGPMQINSIWLPTLSRYGISEQYVLNDGCANVYVGTWILRQEINRTPGDLVKGVGSYHSRTAVHRTRYLKGLAGKLLALLRGDLSVTKIINRANK